MKIASVEVWGSVFGKDVQVELLEGPKDKIVEAVIAMAPAHAKDRIACSEALDKSVWTNVVQWFGNHTIGLKVAYVKEAIA